MKRLEFLQNAMADAAKNLLNVEAGYVSIFQQLLNMKKKYVGDKVLGKTFLAGDLVSPNDWDYKRIDLNAKMKAIAVASEINYRYIIEDLKCENIYFKVAALQIIFMQNPQELLQSGVKYTDKEKSLLKKMSLLYSHKPGYVSKEEIHTLRDQIEGLKHNIHITYSPKWDYSFNDLISSDFLTEGLVCNKTSLW